MASQYITLRETSQILGVSEKAVMDMIESGQLQAFRIADQFLRLKRQDVMAIRSSGQVANENVHFEYTPADRLKDFFYYNDFYLAALAVIGVLLYLIFGTY